jgi:5-hydroxyisourate hydrolase-like protein (transthyretin family)
VSGSITPDRPISNYVVELSDTRRTWRATSNRDGRFEFTGIPAGTYAVKLSTPETEHAYGPKTVTLADPRGCAAADFYVVPDGRLRVRIVDRSGAPVSGVGIELLDVDAVAPDRPTSFLRTLESDGAGRLEFSQLHPKRYALAINATRPPSTRRPFAATYFPGVSSLAEATAIDLGPGERVDLGEWVLPESLRERRVVGHVVWPDGKPAPGAHILMFARTTQSWPSVVDGLDATTDADGRFTAIVHEGIAYEFSAYLNVGQPIVTWTSRRISIPASHSGEPIRLELQPPRNRAPR